MRQSFEEYIQLREMDEKNPPKEKEDGSSGGKSSNQVGTTFSLGKDNDFEPFHITDDQRNQKYPSNKNLAPIVRAFKDSNKVRVYDSADKDGNAKPHTLGSKRLFLVGGGLRDHMMGKTSKDRDLATDATPDEIRMILRDADFEERQSKGEKGTQSKGAEDGNKKRYFYPQGKEQGADFTFGVVVDGEEFELSSFRKVTKAADGKTQILQGSHKDDATSRDMTVNAMYLALTNPDGPNTAVTDFHGGVHDLKSGKVKFIGDANAKLQEDPVRAQRYARFHTVLGKNSELDPEYVEAVKRILPRLKDSVSPERIQGEFLKGLSYNDIEPSSLIDNYKKLGLLDVVLPGLGISETPSAMPHGKDPALVLAALTHGRNPKAVRECLSQMQFAGHHGKRVEFLHKFSMNNGNIDPVMLEQFRLGYEQTGILATTLLEWVNFKSGKVSPAVYAFLNMVQHPRIAAFVEHEAREVVNPEFLDLIDEETMQPFPGKSKEIGDRKRLMEWNRFQELVKEASLSFKGPTPHFGEIEPGTLKYYEPVQISPHYDRVVQGRGAYGQFMREKNGIATVLMGDGTSVKIPIEDLRRSR